MTKNAIWIVDSDRDDRELIENIFQEAQLPYTLQFFDTGPALLKCLNEVKEAPFIILCDVNLPAMHGFELREKLLATPNKKFHSVPFIFWSNAASEHQIEQAYKLMCHGFFVKESNYDEWKVSLLHIIGYWQKSKTPSKLEAPDKSLI